MKLKLNKMFRELRKQGFFAKQNFWCCQLCGWAVVPKDKRDAAFYHKQDADDIPSGRVHLAWRGNGAAICKAAQAAGLVTNWDGTPGKRIEVLDLDVVKEAK